MLQAGRIKQFKVETTEILESTRSTVRKWESNLPELESNDMTNLSKILGHNWDKRGDTRKLPTQHFN